MKARGDIVEEIQYSGQVHENSNNKNPNELLAGRKSTEVHNDTLVNLKLCGRSPFSLQTMFKCLSREKLMNFCYSSINLFFQERNNVFLIDKKHPEKLILEEHQKSMLFLHKESFLRVNVQFHTMVGNEFLASN